MKIKQLKQRFRESLSIWTFLVEVESWVPDPINNSNLTRDQHKALQQLQNNSSIVIKPGIKGMNVVMDMQKSDNMCRTLLRNKEQYVPISQNRVKTLQIQFNILLASVNNEAIIDREIFDNFKVNHPRISICYSPPKIHKHTKNLRHPIIFHIRTQTEPASRLFTFLFDAPCHQIAIIHK